MKTTDYIKFDDHLGELTGLDIDKDADLRDHTWYKTGGKADYLIYPKDDTSLIKLLQVCRSLEVPWFVIGKGANLLVSDVGFRGVVIKMDRYFTDIRRNGNRIKVEAGVDLQQLIRFCEKEGLSGLQNLSGIPGSVGGALIMNAGTDKGEIGDVISRVEVIDRRFNKEVLLSDQIDFAYRSVKQLQDKIILSTILELETGDPEKLRKIRLELLELRAARQPLEYPSCGSIFKRPKGYFAGKLIDDLGLKGTRIGDAMVSEKHAGFIINLGNATSTDIMKLIIKVRDLVKKQYGIQLEPEVRFLGFDEEFHE